MGTLRIMKKQKPKVDKSVLIAAIFGIAAVEIAALFNGIDGKVLTIAVAAMAGLAGWTLPQLKFK